MSIGDAIGGIMGAAGSVVGGLLGNQAAAQASEHNYKAQKEFAQQGIRWRVADAKAAGLHPLAALGAQTPSYTPSAFVGDTSWMGDAASQLGQGIGRAAEAKMTAKERERERDIADQSVALSLDTKRLQNEYLQTQISAQKQDMALQLARSAAMAVRTQQAVPEMPDLGGDTGVIPGQSQAYPTGKTAVEVSKVPTTLRGDPSTQAGTPPDARLYRTSFGYTVLPNDSTGDVLDAIPGAGLQWAIRNNLLPWLANYLPIEDRRRPSGHYYELSTGQYIKGRRFRDFFGY